MAMSHTALRVAVAASLLALGAGQSLAQNPAPTSHEPELRAWEQASAAKAMPLIEADRQHPRIGGFWVMERPPAAIMTVDGKLPPMTSAARTLYGKRLAGRKAGKTDDPVQVCLPPGTPRSMWSGEPFMITQTPAKVTFFHQYRHIVRHVFLDGPLKASDPDPRWQGLSSGYWKGDALFIETSGFNGESWLDDAGLPQSADMKVTERLSLAAPDTLEDQVTIEDPRFYARPWTTSVRFKRLPPDTNLVEEECAEKLLEFPLKNYQPD
jgi:hypothetical protein